jgi:outer membrane protein assembly factor BamC
VAQGSRVLDQQRLRLKRDDPTIGIMETDWVENRADIPQDGLRGILKKYLDILYSAPTRDKFRVRLERPRTARSPIST